MRDLTLNIITRLKADIPSVSTRVYRRGLPENITLPALTVAKIDDIHTNDTESTDYSRARIQVSIFAQSDGEADDISQQVGVSLNAYVNQMLGTISIVGIYDAGVICTVDLETGTYVNHRDFIIMYQ